MENSNNYTYLVFYEQLDSLMDELKNLRKKISELERNNRLFKETEKTGKIGGWQFDPTSLKQTWTDEVFQILEIDLEHGAPEVPKGLEFIDPQFRPSAEKAIQQAMEHGEPYNQEWMITTAKGNKKWVHAVCNPKMENGKVITIPGSLQDITSKKMVEEELKKSEERIKIVIDNNPFPVAVIDEEDKNIKYWSKSAIQLFGYNPKTTEEWNQLAYPNPEYRQEVIERWKPLLKIVRNSTKTTNTGEYEIRCKNATMKICEIFAQFIPGNLIVTFNDITERKKSEEQLKALNQQLLAGEQQLRATNQQLQASEQQLQATNQQLLENEQQLRAANQQLQANEQQLRAANQQLEANEQELRNSKETADRYLNIAAEIILCLDSDGNVTLLNDSGYQLMGYEVGALTGKEWISNCLPKEQKNEVRSVFEQIITGKTEKFSNYESPIRTKSGEIKTILWHNTLLKDQNGKVTGTLSSGEDITERVKTLKELAASESFLKAIFDKSLNAILVTDDAGKYITANESAANLFGYPLDKLLKMNVRELIKTENSDAEEKYKQFVDEGKETGEIEFTVPNAGKKIAHYNAIRIKKDFNLSVLHDITENKKAERELKNAKEKAEESEEKFSTIFNMSLSMICVADINTATFKLINPAFKKILGYEEEELLSKPFLRFIHPDDIEPTSSIIEEQLKTGKSVLRFQNRYKHKNGTYIWLDWNSHPIPEKGITYAIAHDITAIKKTEQELIKAKEKAEESERKLIEAQELSHVGSWEYIIDTDTVKWSKELFNIFERSYDLPAPKYSEQRKYYSEKSFTILEKAVQDCVQRNIPYEIELDIITSSGTVKQIRSKGNAIKDKNNKIIGTYGTAQDITQKKKTEQELIKAKEKAEKSQANVTAIIEGTTNSIWAFNRSYQILYINKVMQQEFLQTFGVLLEPGLSLFEGVPESLRPLWKPRYDRVLANEQFTIEDAVPTDKGPLYIQVSFNPIVKDGKVIGGSCIGSNITSRKLIELELIAAKEKAEESDRLKSAFLANMSHEIRTPMNGILGFTNLLQRPNLTGEEQQKYIEIIQKSGDRMLSTVNDIIDISRIESGLIELSVSEVNINGHLKDLHSFFSHEAARKGIQLILKNEVPGQDFKIKTDFEKFNSIVTNLIKNAVKFTTQGSIELGYHLLNENGSNKIEFYVKVSGIGIPKNRQEAVFDRFVQADIEDKKAKQGSGLGLAISKAYAEMLGGRIWVDSKEGKGSTFYFTIENNSVSELEVIADNDGQILKKDEFSKKLKILVVEDDETSQHLISIMIEKFADKLINVNSGLEAVEVCRNIDDINLIIMDIQLPNMDGYETTRQIRQFNKDVVIIAQTAYALSGDKEKAINMGCNDYISKPIDEPELIAMVKEHFMN